MDVARVVEIFDGNTVIYLKYYKLLFISNTFISNARLKLATKSSKC